MSSVGAAAPPASLTPVAGLGVDPAELGVEELVLGAAVGGYTKESIMGLDNRTQCLLPVVAVAVGGGVVRWRGLRGSASDDDDDAPPAAAPVPTSASASLSHSDALDRFCGDCEGEVEEGCSSSAAGLSAASFVLTVFLALSIPSAVVLTLLASQGFKSTQLKVLELLAPPPK